MATAYSTRLFAGQALVADNRVAAFTAPAGYRVVVRFVSISGAYAAGSMALLYLGVGGPELFRAVPAANATSAFADVRIVFHEGEACYVRSLVTSYVISLHGFILQGAGGPNTPGRLPAP